MENYIIVAGKDKTCVADIRRQLRQKGLYSFPCKTLDSVIEELKILPGCSASVTQVIFEESILKNPEQNTLEKLKECGPKVPFVLASGKKITDENVLKNFSKISLKRPRINPGDQINDMIEQAGLKLIHS